MSVQASAAHRPDAMAVAADFHAEFVRHVLFLVAVGYDRLVAGPAALAQAEEPAITGELHRSIDAYLDSEDAPAWADSYTCFDDPPEHSQPGDSPPKLGKHRPRIDIKFQRSGLRPRPRFRFEAKRLHRQGGIAAYVGSNGLGAFLTGYYPSEEGVGMLGYVQSGQNDEWAQMLQRALSDFAWQPVKPIQELSHSYTTKHPREGQAHQTIYHLLLSFS